MTLPPPLVDIENTASLAALLRQRGVVASDERIEARVLRGGVSNKTVWVKAGDRRPWVVKQALPKLRVAVDWFSSPERIQREALGLRYTASLLPPGRVPELIFEDSSAHVLAMTAVPEPHSNWRDLLLHGHLVPSHVQEFGDTLGRIHAGGWAQRSELREVFADYTFFETLRLEPYYEFTAAQVPAAESFLRALVAETRTRRFTLVHGDYSPKNVLRTKGDLVLLDFEVAHWGDPAFDVGFAAAHFLSKATHLPKHRKAFADAARLFWTSYRAHLDTLPWRATIEAAAIRHTLGCLLARVAGRSPMDYLSTPARKAQREVTVDLMSNPPATWDTLVTAFYGALARRV